MPDNLHRRKNLPFPWLLTIGYHTSLTLALLLHSGELQHWLVFQMDFRYPKVIADQSSNNNDKNRYPLTGTIDQIGDDIRGIKDIGVDHIIFDYMFAPIGSNVDEMIDMSKELSKYARQANIISYNYLIILLIAGLSNKSYYWSVKSRVPH